MVVATETLSSSPTFNALKQRVTVLEENGVPEPITAASIQAALGYVPANKAGESFTGTVTTGGDLQLTNNHYLKSSLSNGTVTRILGLNAANALYVGGIDATISSIVFEVAATSAATITSAGLTVTGAICAGGDANFSLDKSSGDPRVTFDSGDYLDFDRVNNTISWTVGGTTKAYINSSGSLTVAGAIYPGANNNFSLDIPSGVPTIFFDANDAISYNRASNAYNFNIASAPVLQLLSSGAQVNGTFGTTGTIYQNGSAVATQAYVGTAIANLVASAPSTLDTLNELAAALGNDPNFATTITTALAGKASLTGAAFTGVVTFGDGNFGTSFNSGNPYIAFDSADFLGYTRASNAYAFNIANISRMSLTTTALTMDSGTEIQARGNVSVIDANFKLYNNGGPTIAWDSGDELTYNRTGNNWTYYVGGTLAASIAAGGFSTKGNVNLLSATGAIFVGSPNLFQLQENGSSTGCAIQFDTGASFRYVRSSSVGIYKIGGTDLVAIDANSAFATGEPRIGLIGTGTGGSWEFAVSIAHKTGDPTDRRLLFSNDATGTPLFSIDKNGDMRVAGTVYTSTGPLS